MGIAEVAEVRWKMRKMWVAEMAWNLPLLRAVGDEGLKYPLQIVETLNKAEFCSRLEIEKVGGGFVQSVEVRELEDLILINVE